MKNLGLAVVIAMGLIGLTPSHAQQKSSDSNGNEARATPASRDIVRHLVVLNKEGPNFDKGREFPDELRSHRQIYLDLTESGHILASGVLRGNPAMGFVLFREGVDEEWVRIRLEDDFVIKQGILELEFIYWEIQMGGFGDEKNN